MAGNRLLVLGLDGLDPYFVDRHSQELPNLAGLDCGILESTLPPITAPAWMSSFTGKLPERLDRFDFQAVDFEEYDFRPVDETRYWGQEFWSFTDRKVAVADVPGATVHEIDGWMVGGIFDVSEDDTYPPGLAEELSSAVGRFKVEGLENAPESERREKAFEFFERRRETLEWLLDNRDAAVYFPVFRLPDTMMHHGSSEEDLLAAYRRCDKMLQSLKQRDLDIMVVSDHGAVKATRRFSVNSWLRENGFLEVSGDGSGPGEKLRSMVLRVAELAERLGLRDYLVRANKLYGRVAGEEFVGTNLDLGDVDFGETEAFSYMTGVCRYSGIWINDGRFPRGNVEDRQEKKEEVRRGLENHELVEEVLTKEEAFEADAETFPDLVAVLEQRVKNDSDLKPSVSGKISSYMHRKQGFIGLHGDVFELGEGERDLVDLAPTVLHYLGAAIPREMDGGVMDVFADGSEPGRREPEISSREVADLDV